MTDHPTLITFNLVRGTYLCLGQFFVSNKYYAGFKIISNVEARRSLPSVLIFFPSTFKNYRYFDQKFVLEYDYRLCLTFDLIRGMVKRNR